MAQDDETGGGGKANWRLAAGVLALALLVRGAALLAGGAQLDQDPDGYRRLAENLRRTGVYGWTDESRPAAGDMRPTAFRPPLYPLVLAAVAPRGAVSPAAVGALHLVFGLATVALVFLLAQRWGLGRYSAVAALLVACDPILLNQSTLVMTETPATLLAVGTLCVLTWQGRGRSYAAAACAGAVLALASLCRPTFLPWLGVVALVVAGWPCSRRSCGQALTLIAAAALVLAPWALRNQRALGAAKITTTHGGYTVLLGNNPGFYRFLRAKGAGPVWDSQELSDAWEARGRTGGPGDEIWDELADVPAAPPRAAAGGARSELDDDRFAYALAWRYIRRQPGMFVYASLVRVGRLWRLTPHRLTVDESPARRLSRYAVGVWYALLFVLAATGAASLGGRLGRTPWLWGLLLCLVFTGVHAVYWSNMRMRAPLMPGVCLAAAAGAEALAARLRRRK